jgi:hypothetical protein
MFVFALVCVLIGVGLVLLAKGRAENQRRDVAIMAPRDFSQLDEKLQVFLNSNPGLPALPRLSTEYEGWFREIEKRIEAGSLHRTREKERKLLRQVIELHEEYLRYIKAAAGIQEAGLSIQRNARLDSLREEAEKEKLHFDIADLKDKREQIEERAVQRKKPPQLPKQESQLDRLARTYRDEETELKKHPGNPEMQQAIKLHFDDKRMRIKEGRE